MAGSLNKVVLIGNLGKDPDVRTTHDGKDIVNFRIATTESWKDRVTGEKKEKTEWHQIVIFNEALASIAKSYLKKGSKIYIEGALQTRKWLDNATNQEKYSTEVVLQGFNSQLILLDSRGASNSVSTMDTYSNSKNVNSNFDNNRSDENVHDSNSRNMNNNFDHNDLDDEIPF